MAGCLLYVINVCQYYHNDPIFRKYSTAMDRFVHFMMCDAGKSWQKRAHTTKYTDTPNIDVFFIYYYFVRLCQIEPNINVEYGHFQKLPTPNGTQ